MRTLIWAAIAAFTLCLSPVLAQDDPETMLWDVIRDSADPLTLERFLERFPDGKFAEDARDKLDVLGAPGDVVPVDVLDYKAINAQRSLNSMTDCDRYAADPFDIANPPNFAGLFEFYVDPKLAVPACRKALTDNPDDPRYLFLLGRSLIYDSNNDRTEFVERLEAATAKGYAAAPRVLSEWTRPHPKPDSSGTFIDPPRSGPDFDRWQRLLRQSADMGDPFAVMILNGQDPDREYAYSDRSPLNPQEVLLAYAEIVKLADAGMPRAQTFRGYFHYPGGFEQSFGLSTDEVTACNQIEQGMLNGDLEAIHRGFGMTPICSAMGTDWQERWRQTWVSELLALANARNTRVMLYLGGEWRERAAVLGDLQHKEYLVDSYGSATSGETDYARSGRYAYELIVSGHKYFRTRLLEPETLAYVSPISAETIMALQSELKANGWYSGALDGALGPATRAAIALAYNTEPVPPL